MRTMRDSIVSAPTLSARITKLPVPLTVPPVTRAPGAFSTGRDSPVTMDSSITLVPSCTLPSTGTDSPGRTRNRSPIRTTSKGTSTSPLVSMRRAVLGASFSKARIAPPVRARARNSRT